MTVFPSRQNFEVGSGSSFRVIPSYPTRSCHLVGLLTAMWFVTSGLIYTTIIDADADSSHPGAFTN
jgi:hypothetical protein